MSPFTISGQKELSLYSQPFHSVISGGEKLDWFSLADDGFNNFFYRRPQILRAQDGKMANKAIQICEHKFGKFKGFFVIRTLHKISYDQ